MWSERWRTKGWRSDSTKNLVDVFPSSCPERLLSPFGLLGYRIILHTEYVRRRIKPKVNHRTPSHADGTTSWSSPQAHPVCLYVAVLTSSTKKHGVITRSPRLRFYRRKNFNFLLLLLLALQPTVGFSLLSDFLPLCPFFTLLSPPSYFHYLQIFNARNPSFPWSPSSSSSYRWKLQSNLTKWQIST
jgi:hypothetical protein